MPVFPIEAPVCAEGQSVPLLLVRASAGFPSPAGDDLEDEIDPIAWVVRHPSSTFWWRVEGDCLWDVGIRDGDIIAVDRAGKRRLGRAVLAVVDGAVPLVPVGDIWGIGRKSEAKLQGIGITTAADLRAMPLRQGSSMCVVVVR